MKKWVGLVAVLVSLGFMGGSIVNAADTGDDTAQAMADTRVLPKALGGIDLPEIKNPQWLIEKRAAREAVESRQSTPGATSANRNFTYSIQTWGEVSASVGEFKSQASATLSDSRGWSRAGVRFSEVSAGGDFVLVLSEANELARRYAPGCSAQYSCRVGPYVIINQDRWLDATPSWNQAGGSLRDYRHMVINHEVGHWLGHGHYNCGGTGKLAPVMQQQSIDLQGCKFNPWPLESEVSIRR